jgi:hypothetical protein
MISTGGAAGKDMPGPPPMDAGMPKDGKGGPGKDDAGMKMKP